MSCSTPSSSSESASKPTPVSAAISNGAGDSPMKKATKPAEANATKTPKSGDSSSSPSRTPPSSPKGGAKTPASNGGDSAADYDKLISYGLEEKVAKRLDDIYQTGKLSHSDLDDRALDALKEFPSEGAMAVLAQFLESNLEHVSNKSAYLCGVMKTYRQKTRQHHMHHNGGSSAAGASSAAASSSSRDQPAATAKGPDKEKIKAILDRTGYTLDVTTGQRKYGGPPPDWEGAPPGYGCEVFCGKIPRDLYEDELIPLFEKCGQIWDLRLMMDPMTSLNRGYAFVTFTTRAAAQEAVKQLNTHELAKDKPLKVNVSHPKTRLFVGNIPKSKGETEIENEFRALTAGLREVIIYSSPDDKKKNRGFCFLEYESHKAASLAKRRLETGRVKVWSCDIIVDWADPQEEPDDDTMSQVKVLYVRNLTATAGEDKIREVFESYGKVDRVKKIKDYAFVHFEQREDAMAALEGHQGKDVAGSPIHISLAKPPSDRKKKEELLRKREQRMMKSMTPGMPIPHFPPFSYPISSAAAAAGLAAAANMFSHHHHHPAAAAAAAAVAGGGHHHHHPHHHQRPYHGGRGGGGMRGQGHRGMSSSGGYYGGGGNSNWGGNGGWSNNNNNNNSGESHNWSK